MSTIKANTLLHSDGSTTTQPSIPALDKRMAKAWVNFNGTGTVAIRDSYNVNSISDLGVGSYTINFTANMANVNYVVSVAGALQNFDSHTATTQGSSVSSHVVYSSRAASLEDNAAMQVIVFSN
jgi:hypothetical protein